MKSLKAKFIPLLSLVFILVSSFSYSQSEALLKGNLLNETDDTNIAFATIMAYNENDSLVNGVISDEFGHFEIELVNSPNYLKIECLAYQTKLVQIDDLEFGNQKMPIIYLKENSLLLDELEVRAEKSANVFKLDKRVFNVGKDLISQGGSALDVLNNVPSVDVNIEGNVSLRGNSNVLILINGKASVLTDGNALGTLTSDMIEQVEVITNPSAKYDAEGTTGIINLIIKKENKEGWNGAVSLNTGLPNNHSLGFSINRRTEKLNVFSQLGLGYRTFPSSSNSKTIDKLNDPITSFYSTGEADKNEQFYNFILGADYHISKLQMLTLTGHYGYEIEDENSSITYELKDAQETTIQSSIRDELTESVNPKWEYSLAYDKKFKNDEKRSLTASAKGSFFGKEKESDFQNQSLIGSAEEMNQKINNNFSEAIFSFQSDYIHPILSSSTLEAGLKYEISSLNSDFQFKDLIETEWTINENYSNIFEYKNNIAAAYATYAYEREKWGIKGGLRLENTDLNSILKNNNETNKQNYTHLFPSFHSSYKIMEEFSMQLGYSKRIHRPHMWDLNPFASIRDIYNIELGNPNLQPELTDSYELTGILSLNKLSMSSAFFYRNTIDVISNVLQVSGEQSITTMDNIGKSNDAGIELNAKWEAMKQIVFLLDGQMSFYNRYGELKDSAFNFNSSYWSTRLTTKIKLPADFDVELRGRYRSDYQDVQSNMKAEYYLDLGIKKKILKGRGVINLSISDLFDTRGHSSETDAIGFYRFEESRRGRRIIIGFSFGFGKGEAMEYSGQKMF